MAKNDWKKEIEKSFDEVNKVKLDKKVRDKFKTIVQDYFNVVIGIIENGVKNHIKRFPKLIKLIDDAKKKKPNK